MRKLLALLIFATSLFAVTVDYQVSSSAGDAYEAADDTGFTATDTLVYAYPSTTAANRAWGGWFFDGVAVPPGAIVDEANIEVRVDTYDDPGCYIHANDVDDAQDFAENADWSTEI